MNVQVSLALPLNQSPEHVEGLVDPLIASPETSGLEQRYQNVSAANRFVALRHQAVIAEGRVDVDPEGGHLIEAVGHPARKPVSGVEGVVGSYPFLDARDVNGSLRVAVLVSPSPDPISSDIARAVSLARLQIPPPLLTGSN